MLGDALNLVWPQDLPVCFPDRPCVDYSPYEADAINLTSNLTAASCAIAIECFVVLGIAILLLMAGLRSRRAGPSVAVVALSTALVLGGLALAIVVDLRLSAISSIYGLEGPGGRDLFGSWDLVSVAGEAMTVAGLIGLITAALVAIVRLQTANPRDRAPAA